MFKGTSTKKNSAIRKSSPDEQCLFRVRGQNYSGNAHEDENNFLVSCFRVCKKRKKYEKNNEVKKKSWVYLDNHVLIPRSLLLSQKIIWYF